MGESSEAFGVRGAIEIGQCAAKVTGDSVSKLLWNEDVEHF